MNIPLIFGPLAFLSIFYTSAQGKVWPLSAAEVGDKSYINQVSIQRKDGDGTFVIRAIPENSKSVTPSIIHGPFVVRGYGPYSMVHVKIWLNTDIYVSVTFHNAIVAQEFYCVLNPYPTQSFLDAFRIKELVLYSLDNNRERIIEENVSKALDIFVLQKPNGGNSRARSYVVHTTGGVKKEPILIFHSFEHELIQNGDHIEGYIRPKDSPKMYRFRIEFEIPSDCKRLMNTYNILKELGPDYDLKELEALALNTYPTRPPSERGEPSNA